MRRSESRRDWTQGQTLPNLLRLAWPLIINESMWVVASITDMVWLGRLGSASLAGVGVASIVVWILMSGRVGLDTGARALIARLVGGGDTSGAVHAAQQAFVAAIMYSAVVATVSIVFAEPMLALLGLQPDVVSQGAIYMRIQLAGAVVAGLWMVSEGIILSSGDSVTPMRIIIFAKLVHIVLDPFLILGWWIFPSMGVTGAALASVAGLAVGTLLSIRALSTGRTRLKLSFRRFSFDFATIWRIIRIGVPTSVMGIQRSLGNLILVRLLVPFGTFAVASHMLCQRLEMIPSMPTQAFGRAAGVLVGQNLGAGQPARAERSAWQAYAVVQVLMVVVAAASLLCAPGIVGLFNGESGLIDVGAVFLKIAAVGYLLMAFESVLQQAIVGAGDTFPPMVFSIATLWAVQLGLGYALSAHTDLGVLGIRWAMVSSVAVGSTAYVVYFKLGRWKLRRP
jgi:putative MATE family efflux protein